jgi:hypothetical protein
VRTEDYVQRGGALKLRNQRFTSAMWIETF